MLKDAAASIYGARAANGVVVYTTKKGTKAAKKLSISYDGMIGSTNPGPGQKMMNPTDFANWTWQHSRTQVLLQATHNLVLVLPLFFLII